MKKISIAIMLILGLTTFPIYAQDVGTTTVNEDTVTTENTEDTTITDEEIEEEIQNQESEGTLSEQLEVTQEPTLSFSSVLIAVMGPILLIVLAYLIIRMSQK